MAEILPPALNIGDKIGFFSPSLPATVFATQRYQRAKQFLLRQGYQLVEGNLTGKKDFYRSGSIDERAAELNALIRDPQVKCIISTIGGSNSNALLPYIDYDALQADPKIIIGYSDVTALLLGIYEKIGLITFYGPALVASFGEFSPLVDETFKSFSRTLLHGSAESLDYVMPDRWTDERIEWESQSQAKKTVENQWHFFGQGVIDGRLIGGNLNTMAGIWGSEFMPVIKPGDILLIEDSLKSIEIVERALCHLKICGVFDKISALILGKHELFDSQGSGRTPLDVLREVLHDQQLPILYGFDSCHTHPMLTVPLGAKFRINFDTQTVTLLEACVAV